MLNYLANYGHQNISIVTLLFSIAASAAVGAGIVGLYRATHRGLTYDRSFLVTLLLMAPVISLIITIIGNNIALSIGLVGSLSIVRFRTVIKDSRDLIYLLWAIAVGLGAGTENYLATASASCLLGAICMLAHVLRYGQDLKRDFVLVVSGGKKEIERDSAKLLKSEGFDYRLRSLDLAGGSWQIVFEVQNSKKAELNLHGIMEKLEALPGVDKASLLAPNLTLPI